MGLSAFISMLFMILSFVCMLNAYPKRQKPKIAMLVLMVALYGAVIFADVIYIGCIEEALFRPENPIKITESTMYIYNAYATVSNHIVFVVVTLALALLEPVFAQLLKKINTSIQIEEGKSIGSLELSDEE